MEILNDENNDQFDLTLEEGKSVSSVRRIKKKRAVPASSWYYYLGLVGHVGFAIAVPIAGGALLGGYIDQRWSIYPKATLSLLLAGIALGITAFIRTLKDIMDKT